MTDGLTILDAHMHYAFPIREDSLIGVLKETDVDYAVLAALPGYARLDPTPDILAVKARYPERIFAFGCLDCTDYRGIPAFLSRRLIRRVKRLLAAGCDGLKLLEGKPTMRRAYPIPDFDAPVWEDFWGWAEETRLPILWHVNDPAGFWDMARASKRAIEQGWVYGPNDVQGSEQYRQVRAVLERHDKLNICFAHCFFLSAQLPRLTEWMDRFLNMRVDLTPAIEILAELSATPEESRTFIERFPDRILYGTDTGGRAVLSGAEEISRAESLRRAEITRSFLMQKGVSGIRPDGDYLVGTEPFVLHGMGLEREALERIFYRNFLDFVGRETPVPVNVKKAVSLCRDARSALLLEARRRHIRPDFSSVDAAMDRFLIFEEDHT